MSESELIEQLADKEHASWARWMDYLFSKCVDVNGHEYVLIPHDLADHWKRQANTPYAELSEHEKQSDRDEVAHILPIIENQLNQEIDTRNKAYTERNLCVALIAQYAKSVGHKVGIKEHQGEDWEDEWRNVLFIDLPTGQVSWHLHKDELVNFPGIGPYTGEWDGHDTEGKYRRVKAFIHLMNATSKLFFTK